MVSPAWTPDGQYIVVSKSRPPDPGTFWLFMYHRDGGNGVRVGAPPPPQPSPDAPGTAAAAAAPIAWARSSSPDGRFIYYAQRNGTFTYNAQFPLWQVYRHDRETGDASQVTNARGSAMRPAISPDGKWLVYGTRHKTQTGLRVRNLETGAERWLIYPVTRDDQESRASRDTLPRYDFTARRPVADRARSAARFQRVDFATGESRVIPFTAQVQAEIAPRVYTPVRVEDTDTVRARLIRWPSLSPDGKRAGLQRDESPLRDGLAGRHAAAADTAAAIPARLRRRVHADLVAGRPVVPDLRHVDDDRRTHQARARRPAGRRRR